MQFWDRILRAWVERVWEFQDVEFAVQGSVTWLASGALSLGSGSCSPRFSSALTTSYCPGVDGLGDPLTSAATARSAGQSDKLGPCARCLELLGFMTRKGYGPARTRVP